MYQTKRNLVCYSLVLTYWSLSRTNNGRTDQTKRNSGSLSRLQWEITDRTCRRIGKGDLANQRAAFQSETPGKQLEWWNTESGHHQSRLDELVVPATETNRHTCRDGRANTHTHRQTQTDKNRLRYKTDTYKVSKLTKKARVITDNRLSVYLREMCKFVAYHISKLNFLWKVVDCRVFHIRCKDVQLTWNTNWHKCANSFIYLHVCFYQCCNATK